MGVKRWRIKAVDRGEWWKTCEADKVLIGLLSHGVSIVDKKMSVGLRCVTIRWE
jgi:hypothetical protein